jgi:hypothetical protein
MIAEPDSLILASLQRVSFEAEFSIREDFMYVKFDGTAKMTQV